MGTPGVSALVIVLQQAEFAQAVGGLDDRGLGRAGLPAEFLLGAVVVDRQRRRVLAGRLVGRDVVAAGPRWSRRIWASPSQVIVGPSASSR